MQRVLVKEAEVRRDQGKAMRVCELRMPNDAICGMCGAMMHRNFNSRYMCCSPCDTKPLPAASREEFKAVRVAKLPLAKRVKSGRWRIGKLEGVYEIEYGGLLEKVRWHADAVPWVGCVVARTESKKGFVFVRAFRRLVG